MPRVSKQETPIAVDLPEIEGRYADLAGYTIGFETHHQAMDPSPFFKGLPDNRCQSPHWGVVVKGKMLFHYADHSEVLTAGDAYYAPPGHLPELTAGTEVIEFSPAIELAQTMAVIEQNLAAADAGQRAKVVVESSS